MTVNSPVQAKTAEIVVDGPQKVSYEAPAIESVVTLEELEREVHYAGVTGSAFA